MLKVKEEKEKLEARIKELEAALKPFSNAGRRCAYYGNPHGGVGVIAINDAGNHVWELHSNDHDLNGGDDKLLTVQDLLYAYSIMEKIN